MTAGYDESAIAVVGLACRYPGADSPAEFWRNLREGRETIARFSEDDLLAAGVPRSLLDQPEYVRAAGVLEDIDRFDAGLFDYGTREAVAMDPQRRLFLEKCWEALEDAGYDPSRFEGRIGVFAGAGAPTYLLHNVYPDQKLVESLGWLLVRMGNTVDGLATSASYKLDLRGPSLTVQTACSTSLSAIHLACQSLLNGECDLALAGGVTVAVPHRVGYLYREGDIVSPDGHCRPFDERSEGTVPSNGVGLVVLQRLDQALGQGAHVYACILGSAMNNDGAVKMGYTAPGLEGQTACVADALAVAGCEPRSIQYVEGHGTATAIGDPIEVLALSRAFRAYTDDVGFCALGSVKSNIGHTDAAAGVAGLIKVALALHHREIPATLHFQRPNPKLEIETSPFRVQDRLSSWPAQEGGRLGGVSALGVGGTNVHVILKEAPAVAVASPDRRWQILPISARTRSSLEQAARRLGDDLRTRSADELADVAFTLQVGRRALGERGFVVCRDGKDAVDALARGSVRRTTARAARPVVFLFPGGGAQYAGMGRDLYESETVFRAAIDECAAGLRAAGGGDLVATIYGRGAEGDAMRGPVAGLPALFAAEYASARLWLSWGIQAAALLGHSVGEYAAACLAGVLSVDDAIAVVLERARLFETLPRGGMLGVPLSEQAIREIVPGELAVAALNAPELSVVSGPEAAIGEFVEVLARREIESQKIHIDVAAHSPMIDPIVPEFTRFVSQRRLSPPTIPIASNVTGGWLTAADATDPAYWGKHLRQTVRFTDCVSTAARGGDCSFLEVGPGRTLVTFVRQHAWSGSAPATLTTMRHPKEEDSDHAFALRSLASLWADGHQVSWDALHHDQRRRLSLPTYAFDRQRCWTEPATGAVHLDVATQTIRSGEPGAQSVEPAPEPEATRPDLPTAYVAPRDELEESLAAVWSSFLGVGGIGVDDNFFALGGHSLLAVQLAARIKKEFDAKLSVHDIMTAPTIAAMARALSRSQAAGASPSPTRPQDQDGPTDAVKPRGQTEGETAILQEYFLQLNEATPTLGSPVFHPSAFLLSGPIDVDALARAVKAVAARQQILRTTYERSGTSVRQTVRPVTAPFIPTFELVDWSDRPDRDDPGVRSQMLQDMLREPTDLGRGPVVRLRLIRLEPDRHLLMYVMHHIVLDGTTSGLFFEEIAAAYAAGGRSPGLPPLPFQFLDVALHLRSYAVSEAGRADLDFWARRADGLESLALPVDFARDEVDRIRALHPPYVAHFPASAVWQTSDEDSATLITRTCKREGVSQLSFVLAGLALLLSQETGQTDVVVQTSLNLRPLLGADRLIGGFNNPLFVRVDLSRRHTYRELLARVQAEIAAIYGHALVPARDFLPPQAGRVNLGFFGADGASDLRLADATATAIDLDYPGNSPFDLRPVVSLGKQATVGIAYYPLLFRRETAERLCAEYLRTLVSMATNPDAPVGARS